MIVDAIAIDARFAVLALHDDRERIDATDIGRVLPGRHQREHQLRRLSNTNIDVALRHALATEILQRPVHRVVSVGAGVLRRDQ